MYKYCTYKFYLQDGRRIAAFAEETEQKDKLKLRLIYCSTHDQFSKAKAKYIYGRLFQNLESNGEDVGCPTCLYHPDAIEITIDPEKPHQSFMDYMRENYFQLRERHVGFRKDYLVRDNKKEHLRIALKGAKLIPVSKLDDKW